MFKHYLSSCLVVMLLLAFSLSHATTTINNANQSLDAILGNFHSMTANFKQATRDNAGTVLQTAKGKMALQRPGKFRWKISSPAKQLIVADGKQLWFYDIDLEQITVENLANKGGDVPALLLAGSTDYIHNNFKVQALPTKQGQQRFKLMPNDSQGLFQYAILNFKNKKIQSMRFEDNLDQLTTLNFSNVVLNPKLKAATFVFKPPRGIDVIRAKGN